MIRVPLLLLLAPGVAYFAEMRNILSFAERKKNEFAPAMTKTMTAAAAAAAAAAIRCGGEVKSCVDDFYVVLYAVFRFNIFLLVSLFRCCVHSFAERGAHAHSAAGNF